MNVSEKALWRDKLRDGFHALGHCNRIESHATGSGIPDINLKVPGFPMDWWIELKVARLPGDKVAVRPAQWRWFRQRWFAGGLAAFFTAWHRPHGVVYTFNMEGPWNKDKYEDWREQATLVMKSHVDWHKLTEVLKNGMV